jgi:hypothetical protein
MIDYASLFGSGVVTRITVTAPAPECHRNPIPDGKFRGEANFGE